MLMKKLFFQTILMVLILVGGNARADIPKVSNLEFSNNPATLGEWFTVSFEFEGSVDKFYLENTWETPAGVTRKEVKEFVIKPEIKKKPNGLIRFRWKFETPNTKPNRTIKVWVKDAVGNQSNVLSGEVKVSRPWVEEEVKIPMAFKSVLGTRSLNLSGTIYRPDSDAKFPLLVLSHGSPKSERERRNMGKVEDQSKVFVRQGFVVTVPMRRGYGASEGEYAEDGGKCDRYDYDNVAKEAVKDIKATVEFMKKRPYVDTDKKIVMVGQSSGGFSSLAYASTYADEVATVINFAGGKGPSEPYKVCSEERLVDTMGNFGKTAKMPTLWIYTEEDIHIPPKLSKKMFETYKNKGGQGKFILLSSEFGHSFFYREIRKWEPIVDEFLKEINVMR